MKVFGSTKEEVEHTNECDVKEVTCEEYEVKSDECKVGCKDELSLKV